MVYPASLVLGNRCTPRQPGGEDAQCVLICLLMTAALLGLTQTVCPAHSSLLAGISRNHQMIGQV